MATIFKRDPGMVNTNEKKRSKNVITLYVISGIIAAYGAYMIYFNIGYVKDYYASAGTSIASDLANVIQYIVSNSIDYFIYALIIFLGARILKRTFEILSSQRVSQALDSQSNQTVAAIEK
jgi:large-conductance mechanosensitive channel